MGAEEREPFMNELIERIGIKWDVKYLYGDVNEPQIFTFKHSQSHELYLPWSHAKAEIWRFDFIRMLARAKLGEAIDPLFSVVRLWKMLDETDPDQMKVVKMIQVAQQMSEVWMGDLVHSIEPQALEDDIHSALHAVVVLYRTEGLERWPPEELGMLYAITYANAGRAQTLSNHTPLLSEALQGIGVSHGDQAVGAALALGAYLRDIPQLPTDASEALKLFEESTQTIARLLGFPIEPVIHHEGGDYFWSYRGRL